MQSDSKHIISSSSDGTVRVWVPTQRRCIQVLEPFPCIATSLNWHNSMLFIGGQQGQLATYSTTSWEIISSIDDVRISIRLLPLRIVLLNEVCCHTFIRRTRNRSRFSTFSKGASSSQAQLTVVFPYGALSLRKYFPAVCVIGCSPSSPRC